MPPKARATRRWRSRRAGRGLFVDHRDLFRRPLDVAELNRFEAVVLDPPRAGAKEQAPLLAASSVPRIAYVSCNPATFARDARLLVDGGYRLDWVQPVGQFRWSTHVELAAAFIAASGGMRCRSHAPAWSGEAEQAERGRERARKRQRTTLTVAWIRLWTMRKPT